MIVLFLIALWTTFLVTRIITHNFHDRINYGTKHEKSKTPTGLIRRLTGLDIHHIHAGFLILIIALLLLVAWGLTDITTVLLAISLSFIVDQLTPLINRKIDYFGKTNLTISALFHLFITLTALALRYVV